MCGLSISAAGEATFLSLADSQNFLCIFCSNAFCQCEWPAAGMPNEKRDLLQGNPLLVHQCGFDQAAKKLALT